MSFLRKSSKHCLKRSVSCMCLTLNTDWQPSNDSKFRPTVRTFSRTSHLARKQDFYADLEIPKSATQLEIKNAYYALSMKYHPDKNEGCATAAEKFRLISEAYEVLGNHGKRRRYDRGMGGFSHRPASATSGSEIVVQEEEEEDDAQTKFYTQHMKKHLPPHLAERTAAREFDDFLGKQISNSFNETKKRRQATFQASGDNDMFKESNSGISTVIGIFILILTVSSIYFHIKGQEYEKQLRKNRNKEL